MKNRTAVIASAVVLSFLAIACTGCLFTPRRMSAEVQVIETGSESLSSLDGGQEANQEAINAKIIPMLREIVEARKKMLRFAEERAMMGSVSQKEILDAKINLVEVNIRLARVQGEHDAVIDGLQSIVNLHRAHMKELIKRVTAGIETPEALDESEVGFFEARIRLMKEQHKNK